MVGWPSVLLTAELGDLADDVRKLFQELSRGTPGRATAAGDCQPRSTSSKPTTRSGS